MDWNKSAKAIANLEVAKKLRNLSDYDLDDALRSIGLHRRRSASARFFGNLGLVLGGVAVGAVLGMMMGPRMSQGMSAGMGAGKKFGTGGSRGYGAQPVSTGTQGSNFS